MTSKTPMVGRRTGPVALTIGAAAIGLAALLTTAVFTTQAISAEPAYNVKPPLSETTKARMKNGHWTGGAAGMSWQAGQDKSYNASPELSEATKAKMRKGHWEGGAAGMWWVPGPDSKTREPAALGRPGGYPWQRGRPCPARPWWTSPE